MLSNSIIRSNGWFPSIFNDLFDDRWVTPHMSGTTPAVNVSEDDNDYHVEVAAPGMTKDDFKIQLSNDGNLVISMEKKVSEDNTKDNNKTYLRREFSYSKFEQTLVVPENVDREHIAAQMTDGVLTIDLPKHVKEPEKDEPQYIEIK